MADWRGLDSWPVGSRLLAVALLALASASAAFGFGSVTFRVIGWYSGQPIANVDLCLTVNGQRMQRMTDANGVYTTTMQDGPNRIYFAREGHVTTNVDLDVAPNSNQTREVKLLPGTSTGLPADCSIPASASGGGATDCTRITSLQVAGGAETTSRRIRLLATFSNSPGFYRVAEFAGADAYQPEAAFARRNPPWQPLAGGPIEFTLTEPHYGTHVVHLQTRLNAFGCLSAPRSVSLTLRPAKLASYLLRGGDLARFVDQARARGYRFTHRLERLKPYSDCGPNSLTKVFERTERSSDDPLEIVRASFEVFDGPDFNPFWKVKSVVGEHPDLPWLLGTQVGTRPNVYFDPNGTGVSCPGCSATTPRRQLNWRRVTYPARGSRLAPDGVMCVAAGGDPQLTELVLEGPAGEDPLSALPAR